MKIEEGEFKGSKTLTFTKPGSDRGITMGVTKIKLVLDNLDVCRAFVAKYGESKTKKIDVDAYVKSLTKEEREAMKKMLG